MSRCGSRGLAAPPQSALPPVIACYQFPKRPGSVVEVETLSSSRSSQASPRSLLRSSVLVDGSELRAGGSPKHFSSGTCTETSGSSERQPSGRTLSRVPRFRRWPCPADLTETWWANESLWADILGLSRGHPHPHLTSEGSASLASLLISQGDVAATVQADPTKTSEGCASFASLATPPANREDSPTLRHRVGPDQPGVGPATAAAWEPPALAAPAPAARALQPSCELAAFQCPNELHGRVSPALPPASDAPALRGPTGALDSPIETSLVDPTRATSGERTASATSLGHVMLQQFQPRLSTSLLESALAGARQSWRGLWSSVPAAFLRD